MRIRQVALNLAIPLLLAATPLHAQFTTNGCPTGPFGIQVNGFTAGTPTSSQLCLIGNFQNETYNVTLTSVLQTANIGGVQPNSSGFSFSVPPSFYAAVSHPGQPDAVTVHIVTVPGGTPDNQTSTFQVNPPLVAGGPTFISAVNTPVTWTMYTGGTSPIANEFGSGTVPNGMPPFPLGSSTWSGTPTQTGTFSFSMNALDAWNNQIIPTFGVYIVPTPQIANISPNSLGVGAPTQSLTINGSGFVLPTQVNSTPEPGTVVQVQIGSLVQQLTPTNITANQLTLSVPSTFLVNEGYLQMTAINPASISSSPFSFVVFPTITSLSTVIRTAGSNAFTLGVTGAGFANGAVVKMNGAPLPTTFVNSTSVSAIFPSDSTVGAVTIIVANPDGTTSTGGILTIVPAPVLTSLNPSSVNAGGPSIPLTVTGTQFQTGMAIYFNSVPLTTTLIAASKNTMLTATVPAASIASAATVPVSVGTSDGYFTPALPFTIVSTIPPLQLASFSPLPPGMVNTPYTYTFTATGGTGGYSFSLTSGTPPAGLQFSAGVLSGTPTAYGASQFTVQVADSSSSTISRNFTLNIAPAPLTLTTPPLANTTINTPVSIQFAGSGGVTPYSFVEFGALPPGTTMTSAGLLSGTPSKAGSYPFLVFIDDSAQASASKTYTLNVALPGLLITPPSPLPSGQVNQPYTAQLAATGGIGAPYLWSATGLPDGLTIANNSGLIAGIPRASGTFPIAVTLGDRSGATVTQNYTLVIAAATIAITTTSLANGAVGSPYSAGLSASGGSQTYTFTATGLPPGLTLAPYGTLSGTPTAAGPYTIAVTATDANGLTATASFKVTVAPQLVVTGVTISNAVYGTAIAPVQLSATGGTPPYQWQAPNPLPGLSLSGTGTLSGSPTAAGPFSFTVFAVDSNGALASGTVQGSVALPGAPALTIIGLPPSNAPATQPNLQVSLGSPYPASVTANLTLTFAPASGPDDPAIQFSTGGRTAQIFIPANTTGALGQVGVQTGTVAGTITVTAQLLAGSQNVTPTPAPSVSIKVNAAAPVITSITATRTTGGFTVVLTGYSSSRDISGGAYQFTGSAGASLQTTQLSTSLGTIFTPWYASSTSAPYGSQFTLTQPFTVTGDPATIQSVTVTLTNTIGTSPPATAILQ